MHVAHILLTLTALCAGCAGSPYAEEVPRERRVQYLCADGEQIEMRFFPSQGVGVLVREGRPVELQQQAAGSGFVYGNGPITVRGKGEELILEVGRRVPIKCEQRQRARGD